MRHPRRGGEGIRDLIDRRAFLGVAAAALAAPFAAVPRGARSALAAALAPELQRALEKSPFVYVSPLRADGSESSCHAEVWYGWIDGSVVLITGSERWKARSLRRGLDRARLWVGDFGRWDRLVGRNEGFRQGPSFEARAALARDGALLERLLAIFAAKYPDEIDRWRERMRQGHADGTRVLIRYTPV